MKRIATLLIFSLSVLSSWADDYKILQMNTQEVRIGNHSYHKGDVFSSDSIIFWGKEGQAIKAQNVTTKEIYLFTETEFKAKEANTITKLFLSNKHLSARGGLSLSELSEYLSDTFYLLDSIQIESPIPVDSTGCYYITYKNGEENVRTELPSDGNIFYIYKEMLPFDNTKNEITLSVYYSKKGVDEDYFLTDSMRIVLVEEEL